MLFSAYRLVLLALLTVSLAVGCSKKSADDHIQAGDRFLSESRVQDAIIEYRSAVRVDADRGDLRVKLADTLMLVPDTLAALREYVRAADLLPNDVSVQVKAGTLLLMAGALEDAEARARGAVALDPKNASAQILLGNVLSGLKDIDSALTEYQQALALNPAQDVAYVHIARLQSQRGEVAEAEATFRNAIAAAPSSQAARLAFGHFLWANNRPEEAEAMFTAALALGPTDLSANRALGTFYISMNRPEKAEPYFNAMAKTADTPAAFLSLADYYVLTGRLDEARKILAEVSGNEVARDAAVIREAGIDLAEGNRAVALSKLREVLVRRPTEATARMLVARLLLLDGKQDEALAQASSIVEEDAETPVAADAYLLMGLVHAANDRPQAAAAAYEEVLKRQPQSMAANLALGNLRLSLGNSGSAATHAQAVLAVRPDHLEGRALMIRSLLGQSKLSEAKRMLDALQKETPNSAMVFYLRGSAQLAERQADAARASFNRAASLAPDNVQVVASLVALDLAAGRAQDAVVRVETALKVSQSPELLLLGANAYAAAKDSGRVEELLLDVIELQPARMTAYTMLGAMYVAENRLAEARDRFEDAVTKNPMSVAAHTMLGMLLEMQGRPAEAEAAYKQALTLEPGFPIAANNLAWLYVSANRNLDEALQLAQKAVELSPEDPSINDTVGWIYYRKNMSEAAVRHLEFAAQRRPTDPSAHYHLGMAYFQAVNFDKAKQSLQRALTLAPDFEGAAEARTTLSRIG